MNKIKEEFSLMKEELSVLEMGFNLLTKVLLFFSVFFVSGTVKRVLCAVCFLLTFLVPVCRVLFKKKFFLGNLSYKITNLISISVLVGCFFGQALSLLEKYPDFDIVMNITTGITATVFGYYFSKAYISPETKSDYGFCELFSFAMGGAVIFFREAGEFLIDYYAGTNMTGTDPVTDDHWFFKLFGFGKAQESQRTVFDLGEDMTITFLVSVIVTLIIYFCIRIKHKELFVPYIEKIKALFKNFPKRVKAKIIAEIEQLQRDTNFFDIFFWWLTRIGMLYGSYNILGEADGALCRLNMSLTFIVTIMHLIFPKDSVFSKISYKAQTAVTLMAFLGSFMGHCVFVYGIYGRYDQFLHFVSGIICVYAGYYIYSAFYEVNSVKRINHCSIFAFLFSALVAPVWEITEFLSDWVLGSANQSFEWWPGDGSFFFKVFGKVENREYLYPVFDTMYDIIIAFAGVIIAMVIMYVCLRVRDSKNIKINKSEEEVLDKVLLS